MAGHPKVIVFDFDKTLTNKDTVRGYLKEVTRVAGVGRIYYYLYYIIIILYKLKIFNHRQLRSFEINAILSRVKADDLELINESYAKQIELNEIYHNHYSKYPEALVVSASYRSYLKYIFPDNRVIGTHYALNEAGKLLEIHDCWGENKVRLLKGRGIDFIDTLYTDSKDDLPLVNISKHVVWVSQGQLVEP